jgi:hypothetical protein
MTTITVQLAALVQIAAFDRRVKFLGYKYGKKLIKSIGSGTT